MGGGPPQGRSGHEGRDDREREGRRRRRRAEATRRGHGCPRRGSTGEPVERGRRMRPSDSACVLAFIRRRCPPV